MNWTEGNLARHSRGRSARDDVLKRQKQFFAKARTRLLNGTKNPSPAILPFPDTRDDSPLQQGSSLGHGDRPRGSKRRRDDDLGYHSRDEANASVSLLGSHSVRHGNAKTPAQARTEGVQREDDSQQKRQKLLDKTDWAGLSIQQPLEVAFRGIRQTGQLWDKPSRPPGSRERAHQPRTSHRQYPEVTHGSRHQGATRGLASHRIRVQIGSQQMSQWTSAGSRESRGGDYSPLSESTGNRGNRRDPARRLKHRSTLSADGCHVPSQHVGTGNIGPVLSTSSQSWSSSGETRKPSGRCSHKHAVSLPPKIHEPIPLRAGQFPVLEWSPSKTQSPQSMLVETGGPCVKTSRQVADDVKWMKLTEPTGENLITLARGSSLLKSPSFRLTTGTRPCGGRHCSNSIDSHDSQRSAASRNTANPPGLYDIRGAVDSVKSDASAGDSPGSHKGILFHNVTVLQRRHRTATDNSSKRPESQASAKEHRDENQAWKDFISENESDEPRRRAFIEAARSAALCLEPSSPSSGSSRRLCLDLLQIMTAKMKSRVSAPHSDPESAGVTANSNDSNYDGDAVSSVGLSNMASFGTEPSEPTSMEKLHAAHTLPYSKTGATPTPSGGPASALSLGTVPMEVSSDPGSVMATKASSSEDPGTEEIRRPPRFAMPRSFVGKWAETEKATSAQPPQGKATRGRGRGQRKRKASDGRTNIRNLPDFDEDPIEDIDDD